MPKVTVVQKARKPQGKCGRCGAEIKAGDSYRWWEFRFGGRHVRCLDPKCHPRQSELTSSDKLSRIYGVQESLDDFFNLSDFSKDDLISAMEAAVSEAEDVAQEYRDSADAIRDHISESPTADEAEEKADAIDEWVSDLQDAIGEIEELEDEGQDIRAQMDDIISNASSSLNL